MRQSSQMSQGQALALCLLLLDFEIEAPQVQPPPPGWLNELRQASRVIKTMLYEAAPPAIPTRPKGYSGTEAGRYDRGNP